MESPQPGARRVKVYQLADSGQWDDKGTGHATLQFDDDGRGLILVVRSEDNNEELLEHKVEASIEYQRQAETIIAFTEPTTQIELALSFQEVARCSEVWEQITATQTSLAPPADDYPGDLLDGIQLPSPTLSNLEEIFATITKVLNAPRRPDTNHAWLQKDFLRELLDLFQIVEDLEQTETLHTFFNIFRSIFMLNDVGVFEILLSDEYIKDVIGVLEYDPDLPKGEGYNRHRDFLQKTAKFKHVVRLRDEDVISKIHQNFKITYIKDVVLLRYLDDPTLGTLTSMIYFNNVMILSRLSDNQAFMSDLFGKLRHVAPMASLQPRPAPAAPDHKDEEEETEGTPESEIDLETFEVRKNLFLFVQVKTPLFSLSSSSIALS